MWYFIFCVHDLEAKSDKKVKCILTSQPFYFPWSLISFLLNFLKRFWTNEINVRKLHIFCILNCVLSCILNYILSLMKSWKMKIAFDKKMQFEIIFFYDSLFVFCNRICSVYHETNWWEKFLLSLSLSRMIKRFIFQACESTTWIRHFVYEN